MLRNPFFIAAFAAIVVAMIGGAITDIGPWYETLEKPALNPPNWLFGPAWTLIYAFAVGAAVAGWRSAPSAREKGLLLALFLVNAILNILWSVFFFALHRPDWALIEVALLWLSVLALIIFFARFSRIAALALVPYLLWVSFAAYLNYGVVRLNAPFG